MAQLPADLPYDAWLDYLFGHEVGPSGFRESDDWWDQAARLDLAVDYLTRLFQSPEILLERYPRDQIDRGFWFLLGESGHLDRGPEPPDPLNSICYMWWDIFPTWGGHDGEVDKTLLHVMAQTLRLESEPCREAALHGLGHWHRAHPKETIAILDTWLASNPGISPALLHYARSARTDCIL